MQQLADVAALLQVHRGMVNFDQQRKAALWQIHKTVQPLHHIDFPQRAVQVERARVDARGLNAKLPPVARLGQSDVAHVVFQVEIFILYPVGISHIQRHAHHLAAEDGRLVQAAFHMGQHALEPHLATGRGGLVVNLDQRDIGVGMRGVRVQKAGFMACELSHEWAP